MPSVNYSARDAAGRDQHGRISARSLEQARTALEARGLRDITLRGEPILDLPEPPGGHEEQPAPTTLVRAIMRSFASYWWLWGVDLAALWLAASRGTLALGAAALLIIASVAYWLLRALPMVAFREYEEAKARDAWTEAARWLRFLRFSNDTVGRNAVLRHLYDTDEARMWAATGRLDAALARAAALQAASPTVEQRAIHASLKVSLFANAGRNDEARAAAQEAARLCPDVGAYWSEVAMMEARFGSCETAHEALARAGTLERTEMAQWHEQLALALLALREENSGLGVVETTPVVTALDAATFVSPGYRAFAYVIHAAALADAGHVDPAKRFFQAARPHLRSTAQDLVERAEHAIANAAQRNPT